MSIFYSNDEVVGHILFRRSHLTGLEERATSPNDPVRQHGHGNARLNVTCALKTTYSHSLGFKN